MSERAKDNVSRVREQHYIFRSGPVRDVPKEQRPREVFNEKGPGALSDQQLLAILLRGGTRGLSVLDMTEGMLREYKDLQTLSRTSPDDLRRIPGMGPVKIQILHAAFELARRLNKPQTTQQRTVRTPADAAALLRHTVQMKEVESFWLLMLDRKYRLHKAPVEVTRGIIDASLVHPREVFKEAIRAGCAAIVLVHNHPSGDPTPSAEDIRITRQLVEAGKLLEIEVLDHVILGGPMSDDQKDFVSLRESGLVEF